ncbi:Symplekin [Orchesella cincta]|uniref:Symplekin n=1 Tax=Orchesella cincta TaxID=48709 RepID=A0A1D2NGV1_ORCCI|nr:Symplekin [Orchesella cincta]
MSFHHPRSAAAQFYLDSSGGDYMEEEEPVHSGGRRLSSSGPSSQGGRKHSIGSSGSTSFPGGSGSSPTKVARHESFEPNDYQDEVEVAELLTKATVTESEKVKLENLMRVKEIIINKQPALLDNFLNEMLDFQTDNNADVRCYILEFVEDACKTDPETIPKVLHNMMLMLQDKSVTVQKKAVQVIAKLYKFTLMWLCRSKSVTEEMEAAWSAVCDLKKYILNLIDSDLDGIRTHAVKFIESVILLQTASEPDSFKRANDFCLDDVPITVKVARPRKLEEDSRNLFDELLKFHGSRHATSVNLMTCMGSIVLISKMRPHLMGRVVTAMEKLNVILPPTLERSQVTSVRKYMKVQLIGLLRHPKAIDYYDNITTLLTDLGATHSELHKALPNWDQIRAEKRKRQRALQEKEESNQRKRARMQEPVAVLEDYDDDEDMEKPPEKDKKEDLTELEQSIFEQLLTPETVAELLIASMEKVPDAMPAHFMSAFTPVDFAGTDGQIKHVSRLLAAQITAYQLGPEAALGQRVDQPDDEIEPMQIPTLGGGGQTLQSEKEKKLSLIQPSTGASKKKIPKALKLSEVTKPLSQDERQRHMAAAIKRILQTNQTLNPSKTRLICAIAANSTFELRYFIMQHIQEDIKNRLELGISWLFTEYCLCQEFVAKAVPMKHESTADRYEWLFFNLMKGILDYNNESEKTGLAWKLYLEPPMVPDKGLELLKALSSQHAHAAKGLQIFMELVLKRPKKLHYLSALLHFCVHSIDDVRGHAVSAILQIYEKMESKRGIIEDQAINTYCNSLRLPKPPEILFSEDLGRGKEGSGEWSDDLVKACLSLYLKLLNIKNSLIHELAKVYVETTADVKRSILRYVETPIRNMGMDSPELMKLLDSFPKGAETIITKIIHILTDKTLPSADLVSRVRNLYAKRVSDVRFLIPVLNGLTKQEILTALPKLIKLNPVVVKEVFNRLLGIHVDAKTQHASPITPVELMVALHNIDMSKCDMKTVIKATSLCFNETEVYSPEVLAVVINQLLEQSPLPTLLMRTVIQTLALHSQLSGFILNTLGRLVWTQPKVWEGFVKCCQRTIPKSIPILLTLPAPQLQQALDEATDLRQPLVTHLMSLTPQQRSCLPPTILNIVLGSGDAFGLKQESYYGDYEDEVSAIGGNLAGPSIHTIKDEPRSPAGDDELVMSIKDEPHDYTDDQ